MHRNKDFLPGYLAEAPLALAFERVLECRILADRPFKRPVLDLGCGDGLFAKIFFAEKVDTGVDPDPKEIERARRQGVYLELLQAPGHDIPKPDGFFNTIFSNSVLEHINDLDPILAEMKRLISPSGVVYLTVPSDYFDQYTILNQVLTGLGLRELAQRYRAFYNKFWKHYHCHSPDHWRDLVQEAGFEVIESFSYDPKRICLLNDSLVPLAFLSFITKRLFNRWTLFPAARRIVLFPMAVLARMILENGVRARQGGLVFLALKRAEN